MHDVIITDQLAAAHILNDNHYWVPNNTLLPQDSPNRSDCHFDLLFQLSAHRVSGQRGQAAWMRRLLDFGWILLDTSQAFLEENYLVSKY